jgi:hypothetical protein
MCCHTPSYGAPCLARRLAWLHSCPGHRRNGGAGSRQFLQRFFTIGWVVLIRLLAVLLPVTAALYFAMEMTSEISEQTNWYDFLISAVAELVYYERVAHHMGDVAQRAADSVRQAT